MSVKCIYLNVECIHLFLTLFLGVSTFLCSGHAELGV